MTFSFQAHIRIYMQWRIVHLKDIWTRLGITKWWIYQWHAKIQRDNGTCINKLHPSLMVQLLRYSLMYTWTIFILQFWQTYQDTGEFLLLLTLQKVFYHSHKSRALLLAQNIISCISQNKILWLHTSEM